MDGSLPFGEWLKRERKHRLALTQEDLGKKVGYTGRTIRRIEAGTYAFGRPQAERLADLFAIGQDERDTFIRWAQGLPPEQVRLLPSAARPHPAVAELVAEALETVGQREPTFPPPIVVIVRESAGPPVTCSGPACNGQDPGPTGCSAKCGTVEEVEIRDSEGIIVGTVELRWSEICQTNWSRVCNTSDHRNLWLRAYLRDSDGMILEDTVVQNDGLSIYSNMWYAPTGQVRVSACGIIEDCAEVCTAAH